MFRVLIHTEFDDHPPDEYGCFDTLSQAYTCYQQLRATPKIECYDDGVELELVTECDDGFTDCFTLEYFSYV